MFWILGEFLDTTTDTVVIWVGVGGLVPLVAYWLLGSSYFKQKPSLGSVLPESD